MQDDLLMDFKEQKMLIYEQIELFDPLGDQLSKPAARRLADKGVLIFFEILFYILSLSAIAGGVFLVLLLTQASGNNHILLDYQFNIQNPSEVSRDEIQQIFPFLTFAALGILTIVFYVLARCMRNLRLKNEILHFAGKQIKTLVGQHLKRKAAIEAIEQRHFEELPAFPYDTPAMRVNDVPNPGYGG